MSISSRIKKQRRRGFESRLNYENGVCREINGWRLIDIHEIPSEINLGNEFDFYVHNGETYLLRIQREEKEAIQIVKTEGREAIMYLIISSNFDDLKNETLEKMLNKIEQLSIPKYSISSMNLKLSN